MNRKKVKIIYELNRIKIQKAGQKVNKVGVTQKVAVNKIKEILKKRKLTLKSYQALREIPNLDGEKEIALLIPLIEIILNRMVRSKANLKMD